MTTIQSPACNYNTDSSITANQDKQNKKRKIKLAVASGLIPGLGQICDGRYKAGATFVAGSFALGFLNKFNKKFGQFTMNKMNNAALAAPKVKLKAACTWGVFVATAIAGFLVTRLLPVMSAIDAYKNSNKNND